MTTIKVEARGENSIAKTDLTTSTQATVANEDFEEKLGQVLYSVESMGYPISTAEVYDNAMMVYHNTKCGSKYVTLYSTDNIKVSVRVI